MNSADPWEKEMMLGELPLPAHCLGPWHSSLEPGTARGVGLAEHSGPFWVSLDSRKQSTTAAPLLRSPLSACGKPGAPAHQWYHFSGLVTAAKWKVHGRFWAFLWVCLFVCVFMFWGYFGGLWGLLGVSFLFFVGFFWLLAFFFLLVFLGFLCWFLNCTIYLFFIFNERGRYFTV